MIFFRLEFGLKNLYNVFMEFKGLVQVYTGNGKGKTTAALGLALRAAGRNMHTYIAQFMKKGEYGELLLLQNRLSDLITIQQFGLPDFHYTGQEVRAEEREAALQGILAVKAAVSSQKYQLIIMDEINVLLHFGIIEEDLVLKIVDKKPADIELILTGRYASKNIMDRADLISEIGEIKHYFTQGITARIGIEK